jgi:hypothetical protein
MKRLIRAFDFPLRVFFVVLLFAFASSFAEGSPKAESAERAVIALQETLSQNFSYCDVYYEEIIDRIYVRVAVDGLADLVNPLIEAGYDETFEAWAEYKENVITMYDALLEYVQTNYREDLTISFSLLSDEDTSRNFISINGGTKSVFDILYFKRYIREHPIEGG